MGVFIVSCGLRPMNKEHDGGPLSVRSPLGSAAPGTMRGNAGETPGVTDLWSLTPVMVNPLSTRGFN